MVIFRFKGDFYYSTVFLETVLFQKYKKRNGEIGTKKVKRPLIPKFCPFCGEMYVSDKKDDEKLSQAVSNDSWVSIKERLPNKDGKYLVHYQTQVPCDGKYLPKFDIVNYSSCIRHFDFYHNHITHWQALPNPPRSSLKEMSVRALLSSNYPFALAHKETHALCLCDETNFDEFNFDEYSIVCKTTGQIIKE